MRNFVTYLNGSGWDCQVTISTTDTKHDDKFWQNLLEQLTTEKSVKPSIWRRIFGRPRNSPHEDKEWVS